MNVLQLLLQNIKSCSTVNQSVNDKQTKEPRTSINHWLKEKKYSSIKHVCSLQCSIVHSSFVFSKHFCFNSQDNGHIHFPIQLFGYFDFLFCFYLFLVFSIIRKLSKTIKHSPNSPGRPGSVTNLITYKQGREVTLAPIIVTPVTTQAFILLWANKKTQWTSGFSRFFIELVISLCLYECRTCRFSLICLSWLLCAKWVCLKSKANKVIAV